jgi:predicted ArsR family transcriptional regulator
VSEDGFVEDHVTGWDAVHLLAEPNRRLVYDIVRAARRPLTRDEVADTAGVSRRLAAFHLDQLADAGLLAVDFARPPGRRGPGAGRPAKRYTARPAEVTVSVPGRRYDVVARILAAGLRDADGDDAVAATRRAAETEGRAVGSRWTSEGPMSAGATVARVGEALGDLGYEPTPEGDGALRLANCPFHAVVDVAPELVCGINECFIAGVLGGMAGHPDVVARLAPAPPDCCVRIVAPARGG